ncbi:MAG: toll/interleukin-1 receptor domain-containing protein [Comamonadaceae bacterium]|nr:toll/interleukin-1 receptor domain-containing protein [Comamonadaceae bacterium]
MSDVFISYASADRDRAAGIAAALSAGGWRVWWDRQIPAGRAYDQVIEQAIDAARCVVVLLVGHLHRLGMGQDRGRGRCLRRQILVPVLLDAVKLPLEFRRLQAADLSSWDGSGTTPNSTSWFRRWRCSHRRRRRMRPKVRSHAPSKPRPTPRLEPAAWCRCGRPAPSEVCDRSGRSGRTCGCRRRRMDLPALRRPGWAGADRQACAPRIS